MRFKVKSGNFVLLGYDEVDPYQTGEHNHTSTSCLLDINQVIMIDEIPLCDHNRYYSVYFRGRSGMIDHWDKNFVVIQFTGRKNRQIMPDSLTWYKS